MKELVRQRAPLGMPQLALSEERPGRRYVVAGSLFLSFYVFSASLLFILSRSVLNETAFMVLEVLENFA